MTRYMISPGRHSMVYGMAWRGIAWYIVWPGGHGMVYNKAWRGMAWYVGMLMWNSCFMALPWAMIPFTCREADVSWRSCLHVQDPFTSRGTVTCMFRSHVQLLFTLGSDSKLRDCEYKPGKKGSAHLWVLVNSVLFWNGYIWCYISCLEKSFCSNLMNSKLNFVADQRNTLHFNGLGVIPQKLQNDQ